MRPFQVRRLVVPSALRWVAQEIPDGDYDDDDDDDDPDGDEEDDEDEEDEPETWWVAGDESS